MAEWADKKRRLSPETSAEPGPWRTTRTPYLKEPMEAFTDPKVHKIVMVAASQVGKSEFELNAIGYIIDQDPGTILYIHPSLDEARKFSRQRLTPMIRDCKAIRNKVADVKARDSSNTILQKTFPGGSITLIGSNTPRALARLLPATSSATSMTAGPRAPAPRATRGSSPSGVRLRSTTARPSTSARRPQRGRAASKSASTKAHRNAGAINARSAESSPRLSSTTSNSTRGSPRSAAGRYIA